MTPRCLTVFAVALLLSLLPAGGAAWARDLLREGPGTPPLDSPADIDVENKSGPFTGLVFVADSGNHQVHVFTPADVTTFLIIGSQGSGPGEFESPTGIAVDSNRRLFVADTGNDRVQIFGDANDFDAEFIDDFGGSGSAPGRFDGPEGLGVDAADRVYVADTGNDRIQVFHASGGLLETFGQTGNGNGEFQAPSDVAVCRAAAPFPEGRIYVLDRQREDVQAFASLDDGAGFLFRFGRSGSDFGEFAAPLGIAVDHQCNVYVADTGNDRVQMFDADGGFLELFDDGQQDPGGVFAESILGGTSSGVFVSNTGNGSLQKFDWVDYDTTADGHPDSDGDAYPDLWETDGIDIDNDGAIDLELVDADGVAADPLHKDIFIEVDHMALHEPRPEGIADAVAAFAAAPLDNPGGQPGITLHVDVDAELAHQDDITTWGDFDTLKAANFGRVGDTAERRDARRLVFRYALFVHARDGGGSSGRAKSGGNFIVSLGAGWGSNDAGTHSVGSRQQQAGTLMHELGHTLGLGHGGEDGVNYKPNYLSVMNYLFQTGWVQNSTFPLGGRLDYSGQALDELDETQLDEGAGIGLGAVANPEDITAWSDLAFVFRAGQVDGPLDWDGMGSDMDDPVAVDVNRDRVCVSPGGNGLLESPAMGDDQVVGNSIWDGANRICESPAVNDGDDTDADDDDVQGTFAQGRSVGMVQPPVRGHDDWRNLDYNFRNDPGFAGVALPLEAEERELTAEEASEIATFWASVCGGAVATIEGTPDDDILLGTPGDDVIIGLGGDDQITGRGGDDRLCGGEGDDNLVGQAGDDRLIGGPGADRLVGGDGNDRLLGGPDDDVITGGAGDDRIDAGPGQDTVTGGPGSDDCVNGETVVGCP